MKSVIVYGPQGCGKTRNADALKKHFALKQVVEEFECLRKSEIAPEDTLYLSNCHPDHPAMSRAHMHGIRMVAFDVAMRRIEGRR
jgi:MoxR-like ATPase